MTFPEVPPSLAEEYGLEDRQRLIPLGPLSSEDILNPTSMPDPNTGTELGGVRGMVQPPPHVPTGQERLRAIYAIDPADDGTEADSVVPPELEGDFSSRGY